MSFFNDIASQPASADQATQGTPLGDTKSFGLAFNNNFNEQFNRDYVKQQELLDANPRFLRTRQSIEVERRDRVGKIEDFDEYPLFQENEMRPTTVRNTLKQVECNMLNQLYLSAENIEYIQQRIRYEVYMATNQETIIGRQDETELIIIMRSIYFTYGRNLPKDIKGQIKNLNDLVIQDCVPKILSGVQADLRYLLDASSNPIPLSLPQNMSNTGMKQLPSVTSIFNT